MYISTVEMYYSYLAAATWRMRCIFQLVRCIFLSGGRQIYIFPLEIYISCSNWLPPDTKWRPPDISDGHHLQNEMYILSEKMYISTGEMYLKYTSLQLQYTSFHLKYTSHSLSGGCQIYLAAAR